MEHRGGLHARAGRDELARVRNDDGATAEIGERSAGTRATAPPPPTQEQATAGRRRRPRSTRPARRAGRRRRLRTAARASCSRDTSDRRPTIVPVASGRFGYPLAVEVRNEHRPVASGAGRSASASSAARSTPSRRAIASVTLVALSVHTSGRNRPVASANPATAPVASRRRRSRSPRTRCPTSRSRSTTSPGASPTPSAAAMLSPVPGATIAVAERRRRARDLASGRARAAAAPTSPRRGRRSRGGPRDSDPRRGAEVAGPDASPRSVTNAPVEPQRQPVVGQAHAREARPRVGLRAVQPRQLGDRERGDRNRAARVGPRRRARRAA